jgi:hypothetical protein
MGMFDLYLIKKIWRLLMINLKPLTSTLAASVVVTVMGAFDVANAATLTFSFMNEEGPVAGTVEGEIELPDEDGTFAATAVTITSAPAALGYTLPIDALGGNAPLANTFTIVNYNECHRIKTVFIAKSQ